MTALLDTHILIWWINDSNRLSPNQQEVVASASAESPLLVSDISLWEVATLHSLGRIQLTINSPSRVAGQGGGSASGAAARHLPGHCGGAGHRCLTPFNAIQQTESSWRPPGYSARRC